MVKLNKRGQIAFESLLLLLVVITATTLITSLYFQINDETLAIGYARIGTLEELSTKNSDALIEKINFQRSATAPRIIITLNKQTQLDILKIETLIKTNTNLKNIQVEIK